MCTDWIKMIKVEDNAICQKCDYHFPLDRYFFSMGFEAFSIELNLQKKWLIFCIYNPRNRFIKDHLKEM